MKRKSLAEERPEPVPQWGTSNTLSPQDASCGSHKKVWWVCDKGHEWEAVVKNRALLGSGCPNCEHRAVLKGYNDLQTVNPKLAKTWSKRNPIKPSEVSSRSNAEVFWKCNKGHEWKLAKLLNISEIQMRYITNAPAGSGVIKYGSALVPFVNKFNRDTILYQLMTTRPGEGQFANG